MRGPPAPAPAAGRTPLPAGIAPPRRSPASMRSVSARSRAETASWPHPAIISIPTEAISSDTKWSRSPMSKRRAPGAKDRSPQIGHALGGHPAPPMRRLLQRRHALPLPALGDVEEGPPVRAEHPFVGGKHQEVGVERRDIRPHHAHGVRRVDDQRRPARAEQPGHALQRQRPAVRPVHGRHGRDRHRRRARPLDRLQQRRGPVAVPGPPHGFHDEALRRGARHPLQHGRGVVVLQHQHARTGGKPPQRLAGGGNAVAHGRDQGDVGGIGVDQPRRGGARPLVLRGGEVRGESPRAGPCARRRRARPPARRRAAGSSRRRSGSRSRAAYRTAPAGTAA